jgi:hypothetical protein
MTDPGASIDPSIAAMQASAMQTRVEGTQATLSSTGVVSGDAATTMITSLEDFRKKFPALYKAMLESLAQEMMRQSQRANDRMINRMREQRYSS